MLLLMPGLNFDFKESYENVQEFKSFIEIFKYSQMIIHCFIVERIRVLS